MDESARLVERALDLGVAFFDTLVPLHRQLEEVRCRVRSSPLKSRVTLLVDAFAPAQMPDVYRASDCVLFLSDAEGFGLGAFDVRAGRIRLPSARRSRAPASLRSCARGSYGRCKSWITYCKAYITLWTGGRSGPAKTQHCSNAEGRFVAPPRVQILAHGPQRIAPSRACAPPGKSGVRSSIMADSRPATHGGLDH